MDLPAAPFREAAADLIGPFHGSESQLRSLWAPAFKADTPTLTDNRSMDDWPAQDALEDHDPPTRFHERSEFLPVKLDSTALHKAGQFLNAWPDTEGQADLRFFQTGGVMNQIGQNTSFVHRRTKWLMDIGLSRGRARLVAER